MHVTLPHSSVPVVCVHHATLNIVKLHDDICATLLRDPTILPLLPENLVINSVQIPVTSAKKSVPFTSLPDTYSSDGYVHLDGSIYIPLEGDLCLWVLQFKHDHSISGHPGITDTIKQVQGLYLAWTPQFCQGVLHFLHHM
jgi:hypothetical protein